MTCSVCGKEIYSYFDENPKNRVWLHGNPHPFSSAVRLGVEPDTSHVPVPAPLSLCDAILEVVAKAGPVCDDPGSPIFHGEQLEAALRELVAAWNREGPGYIEFVDGSRVTIPQQDEEENPR